MEIVNLNKLEVLEVVQLKTVTLVRLKQNDKEQFIKDNQEAFNYGALEEFGRRDDHFEEDGEIISRETIEKSIDSGEAYRLCRMENLSEVLLSGQMVNVVSLTYYLFLRMFIVKGLVIQHGVKWKKCIRK